MTELYKRNGAVFITAGITLEGIEELKKEKLILKKIILDAMAEHTDLCILCQNKGQVLPECNITEDKDCLKHLIDLYKME